MSEESVKMPKRPSDRLTVNLVGEDGANTTKELFMSAGMERHLANIVNTVGDVSMIFSDPSIQSILMIEVLKPRTKRGEEDSGINYKLDDFPMSTEEGDKLMAWVGGHVMHFFISNAKNTMDSITDPQGQLKALMGLLGSANGLLASLVEKPSVGPTIPA